MSTTQNDTTTRSISDTVQQSLQDAGYGSYMTYARPVIEALTAREQEIAARLIDRAGDMELDESEIREALSNAGLSVREPEPEVEETEAAADGSDTGAMGRIEQMLTSLTGRIDSLTEFARRNGYRS